MNETDLVQRSAVGDVDAFTLLVHSRRERVFWIAYHLVGERELARDVTQEVFLRLFRVFEGRASTVLCLRYRSTRRICLDRTAGQSGRAQTRTPASGFFAVRAMRFHPGALSCHSALSDAPEGALG